jgi:queuine tRNA-ribosyltransferase
VKTFKYTIIASDGHARLGRINTAHGAINTPVFMPVGTRASLKTMSPIEAKDLGVNILLGNTYHLYLKPGDRLIGMMGGLHKFMAWDRPILTDSGGFQVFSLGMGSKGENLVKIRQHGVEFRSHIDGSTHLFTPISVIDIQANLGSDIAMVLDECVPGKADHDSAKRAMDNTHRWAREAHEYKRRIKSSMALFGIVQGATYSDLRKESAEYINGLDFDGNAIGGVAVGETKKKMYDVLDTVLPILSPGKPRYLMGIGEPEDILEAVERGVDMFDCVMPTRNARNGTVLTFGGRINLSNAKYKASVEPMEKGCDCYACRNFSRAYVRHLLNVGELLGIRLTTIHNIRFMMRFMDRIREAIGQGKFRGYKRSFLKKYLKGV